MSSFDKMCDTVNGFVTDMCDCARRRKVNPEFTYGDLGNFWHYKRNGSPAEFLDYLLMLNDIRNKRHDQELDHPGL